MLYFKNKTNNKALLMKYKRNLDLKNKMAWRESLWKKISIGFLGEIKNLQAQPQ